jgi:hypothetical protein
MIFTFRAAPRGKLRGRNKLTVTVDGISMAVTNVGEEQVRRLRRRKRSGYFRKEKKYDEMGCIWGMTQENALS